MGYPPVVVVESGGVPRTQVAEGVSAPAFTVVESGARPITLADNAPPIALFNEDGTPYTGGGAGSWAYPGGDYTFARSSTALYEDAEGDWVEAAVDELRIDPNGNLILERATTNLVRNPEAAGASAPSTYPTNWTPFAGGSASQSIASVGTLDGLPAITVQLTRAATGVGSGYTLSFEPNNQIDAVQGDVITLSVFAALAGGDFTNITACRLRMREYSAAAALLATQTGDDRKTDITSDGIRMTQTITVGNASTAFILPQIEVTYGAGTAINLALQLAWPQVEKLAVATTPVDGTRAEDLFTPTLPAGTNDLTIEHDDLSLTVIPDVSAPFTIDPETLSRPLVKSLDWRAV